MTMAINLDNSFWNNAIANAVGTIIAASITGAFGFFLFDPLRQWVYKNNPKFARFLLKFLDFIYKPVLWIAAFFTFQAMIFFDIYRYWSVVATSIILLRFYFSSKSKVKTYPSQSSQFSDGFHKLEDIGKNWETITGQPSTDEDKGNPRPSLHLTMTDPPQATNTFLLLKKITSERGVIECDFFLGDRALLNIVFMCDKTNHNWHMARYDSRGGTTDGLLIKDGGKGNNWRFNNMSTARSNSGSWYRAKIEFSSERARMFKNGELVAEITNPKIFGKYIGFFNECGNVNVDNFKYSAL
jgi:hypothetical protein